MSEVSENLFVKKAINYFGTQEHLAKAVGVRQPTVNRWLWNKSKVDGGRAFLIEFATKGSVKKEDLNPDFFKVCLAKKNTSKSSLQLEVPISEI